MFLIFKKVVHCLRLTGMPQRSARVKRRRLLPDDSTLEEQMEPSLFPKES